MANDAPQAVNSQSALSGIVDRLRTVFGLAGDIRPRLENDVTLVAIAEDLTQPGCSPFRGRRFIVHPRALVGVAWGAGFGYVIRLGADCIINQLNIRIGNAGLGEATVWFLPPDTAPVNAPNVQGGTWIDNKRISTDLPPFFLTGGAPEAPINLAGETAPTSRHILFSASQGGGAGFATMSLEAFFPLGTHIICRCGNASTETSGFGIYGRIF